jgi:alkylation response protein AidB-like acyl-CoA dehydrogenase
MDYRIDDDVAVLRGALLEFLRERLPDPAGEPTCDARLAAWRELVASEWLEHCAAATGVDSGPAERVAALHVAEAFGAVPVTGPVDAVAGYLLPLMHATGWRAGLERLRDGSMVTAVVPALDEPGPNGTSRRLAARLPAVRTGDNGVRVTGRVTSVPCASDAAAMAIPIGLDGHPALALVDLDRDGVTVGTPSGVDLRRPVAVVTLDGVSVDGSLVHTAPDLLGLEHTCATGHSLFLDAEAVGGGGELIARTVAYCAGRMQFGRPIGSFQAVRHRMADVTVKVEGARSLAYRAAWDLGAGTTGAAADVVASRLWSSAAYVAAGEAAVQCHGGMGFTWEQRVHLWYRAALAGRGGAELPAARAAIAAHLRRLATESNSQSSPPSGTSAAEPVGASRGAG